MRLLEHFDAGYYDQIFKRSTQLHLWVPPVPGDAGVTIGAAYAFAAAAGVAFGPTLEHAFYCGRSSSISAIVAALNDAADIAWMGIGDASLRTWTRGHR